MSVRVSAVAMSAPAVGERRQLRPVVVRGLVRVDGGTGPVAVATRSDLAAHLDRLDPVGPPVAEGTEERDRRHG